MSDKTVSSVPWSFWTIGVVALVWNLMGVLNFVSQMSADAVAAMPEPYRVMIEGRPMWATVAFAVAVFGGSLGCVLLLMRRSAAYYLFIASLVGAVMQMPPHLGVASAAIGGGAFLRVGAFLIWYSKHAESKGWFSGVL